MGERVYQMGMRCYHPTLDSLYDRPSCRKVEIFNRLYKEFKSDEEAYEFGVGSSNSFSFTCSWYTKIKGEEALRVITKDNSYLVWLKR